MTLPVADVRDFDRLPVLFRSMAADLVTGELVVLCEGTLSQAILASMAMPGAFEPVEIDGRLLVDGGILRNVPVDVVREMGADVVIAVDVSFPLAPPESLRSAHRASVSPRSVLTFSSSARLTMSFAEANRRSSVMSGFREWVSGSVRVSRDRRRIRLRSEPMGSRLSESVREPRRRVEVWRRR